VDDQVRADVLSAMRDEAFAYAKYALFAKQAQAEGRSDVASLFQGAAMVELHEHFAGLAETYGLGGSSAENLEEAIRGESAAIHDRYELFAARARTAGEQAVADQFIAFDEEEHAHLRSFEQALEEVWVPS
jgi:rubrerythrin